MMERDTQIITDVEPLYLVYEVRDKIGLIDFEEVSYEKKSAVGFYVAMPEGSVPKLLIGLVDGNIAIRRNITFVYPVLGNKTKTI